MLSCSKCYSNEIEERVWIDHLTGEITSREDEYYCKSCSAIVGIILTPDHEEWIEDIEPLKEDDDENNQIIPNVVKPSRGINDE